MFTPTKPTVYYNSACPVCDAGICTMKKSMPSESVDWVDVHSHPDALHALGVNLEDVRERLHVVDATGRLHLGYDAVTETWTHLPRWGWISRPLRWFGVRHLGRVAYNAFAKILYRWNRQHGHW